MEKILLIEDEESIAMSLQDDLRMEGYQITTVTKGFDGLEEAKTKSYDLIILDLMLPDINGFEVCKKIREANIYTPILILSVRRREIDKVLGLELGADDYVTKPFKRRELLARIHAILRRTKQIQQKIEEFSYHGIKIDFKKYEVKKNDKPIYLTSLEFSLLHYFVTHINEVLTRNHLLDEIWGEDVYVTNRTIDTHIAHLRKKLEDDPSQPRNIISVHGTGYKFTI